MTLRTLNSGNYGIFLIMGDAGIIPSTLFGDLERDPSLENYPTCMGQGQWEFRAPSCRRCLERRLKV